MTATDVPRDAATLPPIGVLDSRRRLSLARHAHPGHDRYFIHVTTAGVITLTPAAIVSDVELAALADPQVRAAIDDFLAHPENGSRRARPARQG
jgi:hypothetical protein